MWYEAIDREDFALVTRSVEASHAVHRALIPLEDTSLAIGPVLLDVYGSTS